MSACQKNNRRIDQLWGQSCLRCKEWRRSYNLHSKNVHVNSFDTAGAARAETYIMLTFIRLCCILYVMKAGGSGSVARVHRLVSFNLHVQRGHKLKVI